MIPYFFVAVFSSLSSAVGSQMRASFGNSLERHKRTGSSWTPFDWVAVGLLVAFSGMRKGVGTDYGLYVAVYSRLDGLTWAEAFRETPQELGYTALSLLLHTVSEDPSVLFWVTSALTVVPFYAAIKFMSPYPALSTLLYVLLGYYLVPLNIVRQGIAMALNFYSLRFLGRSTRKFVCLNVLAAGFHVSVIPVALLQYSVRKLIPSRTLLFTTVAITVVLVGGLGAFEWARTVAGLLNPRYENYLSSAESSSSGIGSYLLLAARIGLVIYSLRLPLPKNMTLLQVLLIISVPFQACALVAPPIARLEYYFSAVVLILIPAQISLKNNKVIHGCIFTILSSVYFVMFLLSFGDLLPYKF